MGKTITGIENWFYALACMLFVIVPNYASAQPNPNGNGDGEQAKGPVDEGMKNIIKAMTGTYGGIMGTSDVMTGMGVLPPLAGLQAMAAYTKEEDKFGDPEDYSLGNNSRISRSILFRPLASIREYSNSEVIKEMLKEMVTNQVPVLMQTMYMVENGAASGYGQALNAVTNIMGNTISSQDFQMKLIDLVDETGQQKYAYAAKFGKLIESEKSFLGALHGVVGDAGSKNEDSKQSQGYKETPKNQAFKLADLSRDNNSGGGTGAGANNNEIRLRDLLFFGDDKSPLFQNGGGGGQSDGFKNKKIEDVKKEFEEYVGDYVFTDKNSNTVEAYREVGAQYQLPKNQDGSQKRTGAIKKNAENMESVWKAWHNILKNYCEFKKGYGNHDKEIFKKDSIVTSKKIQIQDWQNASAPDIPMTMTLIEQAFQLITKQRVEKDLKCDELIDPDPSKIPTKEDGGSGENFDPCKEDQSNGCVRNRLFFYITSMIARSRTLHYYREFYEISKRFASDSALDMYVEKLFQNVEGIGTSRDVGGLDDQIVANQTRWLDFLSWMGKLTQGGVGAGSPFRPNMSGGLMDPPGSAENGAGAGNGS